MFEPFHSLKAIAKGLFMLVEEFKALREEAEKFAKKQNTTPAELKGFTERLDKFETRLNDNDATDGTQGQQIGENSAAVKELVAVLTSVTKKLNEGDIEGAKETAQGGIDNAPTPDGENVGSDEPVGSTEPTTGITGGDTGNAA